MLKKLTPYLNSLPALILISLIILFPIGYTFYISITNMNIFNWFEFNVVGLVNYERALFVLDSGFFRAAFITLIWTGLNMVLQLLIAFIIASLLNHRDIQLKGLYKTLLLIPWAIPGYVSILLWRTGMFNTQFGLLNQWLRAFNVAPVQWLSTEWLAFTSMLVVNLWLALPFMIMIMDGALQSIDRSYYEALKLDSNSIIKKARFVTIPLMKPAITPAVIITLFTTFKQFDVVYLMILQPGQRTGADIQTIITYAYENAFITNNYGYSSAISVIIFIILIVFVLATNRDLRSEKND